MTLGQSLSLWIKVPYTLFVIILIPTYWRVRGPANFLWFSDIALFLGLAALWLENRLLASMMAVGMLAPELVWNLSFFGRLLTGHRLIALTDYMSDPKLPLFFRGLSLFHVLIPPVIVWMLCRLGYDSRALKAQILLSWIILPLSRVLTAPVGNVNWVYSLPGGGPMISPGIHLALLLILYPLLVCWPTHFALRRFFSHSRGKEAVNGRRPAGQKKNSWIG